MTAPTPSTGRARVRAVLPDLYLGRYKPGPHNSITDVPGVLASTVQVDRSDLNPDAIINTGVTAILPRKDWFRNGCHAAFFSFNGSGECTGAHWINETGRLNSPILITNSFAVGDCYRGIYEHAIKLNKAEYNLDWWFLLPVVAETFDGMLNDIQALAVTPAHAVQAIESASSAPVPEGNTGGGTGMCTMGHKGGTGSTSRVIPGARIAQDGSKSETSFTLAALVQSNFGGLHWLTVGGAPVGRWIEAEREAPNPVDTAKDKKDGSIVIVLATDAPLHPLQLQRLAKRAASGLARVGGWGSNQSGDLFLAFSTGNDVPVRDDIRWEPTVSPDSTFEVVDDMSMDRLLEASCDVVEEAILNAMCMAQTMVGPREFKADALDLEWLKRKLEGRL